jgi:hypothetical protein
MHVFSLCTSAPVFSHSEWWSRQLALDDPMQTLLVTAAAAAAAGAGDERP